MVNLFKTGGTKTQKLQLPKNFESQPTTKEIQQTTCVSVVRETVASRAQFWPRSAAVHSVRRASQASNVPAQ
jgi:hypothetical protein